MAKVIIYLRDNEITALNTLAEREYRAPKAQAALIIRMELVRQGLLPPGQQTGHQLILSKMNDKPVMVKG